MKVFDHELLAQLGLLSKKTSRIKGYTNKLNANLNIMRLYNGYEDCYDTWLDVEEIDYKIPVITDFTFSSSKNSVLERPDCLLWLDWVRKGRTLFILSNNNLIKIDSDAQLDVRFRTINSSASHEQIKEKMADLGIAADKVEVIDYFRSKLINAFLNRMESDCCIETSDFDWVYVADLVDLTYPVLNDFILSIKNRAISLDLTSFVVEHEHILHAFIEHEVKIIGLTLYKTAIDFIMLSFAKKKELLQNIQVIELDRLEDCQWIELLGEVSSTVEQLSIHYNNSGTIAYICQHDGLMRYSRDAIADICQHDGLMRSIFSRLTRLELTTDSSSFLNLLAGMDSLENMVEFIYCNEGGEESILNELLPGKLSSLRKLSLIDCEGVASKALNTLQSLTHFETTVKEMGNFLTPASNSLQVLRLKDNGNSISYEDLITTLNSLPALEELYLDGVNISDYDPTIELKKGKIKKIWLNGSYYEEFSVVRQIICANAETLEHLTIGDFFYFNSQPIVPLPRLTYFNLKQADDTGFDATMHKDLSEGLVDFLKNTPNLQSLHVTSFYICDINFTEYEDLKLKQLHTLVLHTPPIPSILQALIQSTAALDNLIYIEDQKDNYAEHDDEYCVTLRNAPSVNKIKQAHIVVKDINPLMPMFATSDFDHLVFDCGEIEVDDPKQLSLKSRHLKLINTEGYELAYLHPSCRLRHLALTDGTPLAGLDNFIPACFSTLESLAIEDITIEASNLKRFLLKLSNLKHLTLNNVVISTSLPVGSIFKELQLPHLQSVICSQQVYWPLIKQLASLSHLQLLDIAVYPSALVETLMVLPKLEHLVLTEDEQPSAEQDDRLQKKVNKKFPNLALSLVKASATRLTTKESSADEDLSLAAENGNDFYPLEFFIPKANKTCSTTEYRLKVHHKPAMIDSASKIKLTYNGGLITPFTNEEVQRLKTTDNLRAEYDEHYHQTSTIHYGCCPVVLTSSAWHFLPSLSPTDKLLKFKCKADIELGYCAEKKLYALKLADNGITDEYNVELLIESKIYLLPTLPNLKQSFFLEVGKALLKSAKFSLSATNTLVLNNHALIKELYTIRHQRLFHLTFLAESLVSSEMQEDIQKIYADEFLFVMHSLQAVFSCFQQGALTGPIDKGVDLITTLLTEQKGACRHRAIAFKILCDLLLPKSVHNVIYNDAHAYVEVARDKTSTICYTIDLGGYPSTITNQPTYGLGVNKRGRVIAAEEVTLIEESTEMDGNTAVREEEKSSAPALPPAPVFNHFIDDSDSDEEMEADTPVAKIQERKEPQAFDFLNNPFVTWRNAHPGTDFITFYAYLLQRIVSYPDTQRNILLTFEQASAIQLFNNSISGQNKPHYYLNSLNSIQLKTGQISDDGSFSEIDSPLALFLKTAEPNSVLLINWSGHKPRHIGYNTVIDTQKRRLKGLDIPAGVIVIVLIDKESVSSLREDFYSRFRIKIPISAKMIFPHACYDVTALPSVAAEDNYSFMAWGEDNWERYMLMEIVPSGNLVQRKNGCLLEAIEQNKKQLIIINPPQRCAELTHFVQTAMQQRSFFCNGDRINLPEDFAIYFKNEDYHWEGNYKVEYLNDINYLRCTYVLNTESFNHFFHTYQFKNGGLIKQQGILNPAEPITILVTDHLNDGQWARLLDLARQRELTIEFVISKNLTLPLPMAKKLCSPAVKKSLVEPEGVQAMELDDADAAVVVPVPANAADAASTAGASTAQVSYIVSPDIQAYLDTCDNQPLIMTVNQDMGYELVETLKKEKHSTSSLRFNYLLGALAANLNSGNTVLLKIHDDGLSTQLALSLESLFLPRPYLLINGERCYFSGQLIIVCNHDNYFPLFNKKIYHPYTDQLCQSLLEKQFGDGSKEKITKLIAMNQLLDKRLSYGQLKTILLRQHEITADCMDAFLLYAPNFAELSQRLHANAGQPPLAKPIATSAAEEYKARAQEIIQFAEKNPCISLVGPTGSGKSSIVLQTLPVTLKQLGINTTLFVGLDKLQDWANKKPEGSEKIILFIDEANLLSAGSIECFEDLYNPKPSIVINGQYICLTSNHLVILAGNAMNYEGRVLQMLPVRHGCFFLINPLAQALLSAMYIQPYLYNPALHQVASSVFLQAYELINKENKAFVLTPRNLKNMTYRARILREQASIELLNDTQVFWLSCYDEIRYALSPAAKKEFKHALLQALPNYKAVKALLAQQEAKTPIPFYAATHLNARRLLQQHLKLREYLIRESSEPKFSMSGLFFIGMPGVGKSSMVEHYLRMRGIPFINVQETNQDEAENKLHQAFHQGLVVLIDEMNTMPFLEYSLNAFTMGVDLAGNPPKNKGFLVIGTGNPISFGGRFALTPAAENRFLTLKLKEYQRDDLCLIGKTFNLEAETVKTHVDSYLAAKNYAQTQGCFPKPSARDMINFFHTARAKQPQQVLSHTGKHAREDEEKSEAVAHAASTTKRRKPTPANEARAAAAIIVPAIASSSESMQEDTALPASPAA